MGGETALQMTVQLVGKEAGLRLRKLSLRLPDSQVRSQSSPSVASQQHLAKVVSLLGRFCVLGS